MFLGITVADIVKLLLAAFLGAVIGLDRESKRMPLGMRTYLIVSVSSCLIQAMSMDYSIRVTGTAFDPSRMSSQVISGIGFLGMASVIKEGKTIIGLTTAASIWATACIGLAVGMGFYGEAILTTMIIIFALKSSRFGFLKKKNRSKRQNYSEDEEDVLT